MHYHASFGLNKLSQNFAAARATGCIGILFMKIPSANSGEKGFTRGFGICIGIVYRLIYQSVTRPLIYPCCHTLVVRISIKYTELSYHHHQIGSMNYYSLFRVRPRNNGLRCMSLYILKHMEPAKSGIWLYPVMYVHIFNGLNSKMVYFS